MNMLFTEEQKEQISSWKWNIWLFHEKSSGSESFYQSDPLSSGIFIIPDHRSLKLFSWSLCSSCFLYTSLFSVTFFSLFLNSPQWLPVFLPEGFLFHVQQLFQVTGDPGFVTGGVPDCSCGNNTLHTKVNVIFHALSHGIAIISMWLRSAF